MLTPTEESGLRNILDDFLDSDLFSLADTVTKRLLETKNRDDAIEAILSCLQKPSDLLKRQRVTKRVLFSYLQKIMPVVSPECTKADLVKMCLEEWHSIEKCKVSDYETNSSKTSNTVEISRGDWLSKMGFEFSLWFFPIYNQLQGFGTEHFWVDCRLKGELKTASDIKEVDVAGDHEVVKFLSSLVINDKFYFDANSNSESIVCEQDPHGLIKIIVSGIVHQFSNCIGLFDCAFGLVRNPAFDNNWKIKWIHMKIQVTTVNRQSIMPTNPSQCIRA